MFSKLIFLFLLASVPLSFVSATHLSDVQAHVKSKPKSASLRCPKTVPTVTEAEAIRIAEAEVHRGLEPKASMNYTQFLAMETTRKAEPQLYWVVITTPDSREMHAAITIKMNRCGEILEYRPERF
jgi:hypothetical protein